MPLFFLFFVILLPSMEVYLLFSWIGDSPVIALLYVALTTLAGIACLRLAKAGLRDTLPRLQNARTAAEMRTALYLGKLWLVGALLLFPGYLSDIVAALLLLLTRWRPPPAPDDGILETRARVLDDD